MLGLERPQTRALGLSLGLPRVFKSAAVSDFTEGQNLNPYPSENVISLLFILNLVFRGSGKIFHRRCLRQMHKQCCRCNIPTCSLEEYYGSVLDVRAALGWWLFGDCFKFGWLVAVEVLVCFLFGFFCLFGRQGFFVLSFFYSDTPASRLIHSTIYME